ncbi:PEP-CTERM sorting domain-containing protein [Aeoliella sp.]|uniref:PEP-CTERM sorting domain-containing protein n=1 Tax=Aeoliella sp. TaxID=2795800 RepID=UPI003CCBBD00
MLRSFALLTALAVASVSQAAITYDDDVTPDVIFGSGNLNGGYTIDRDNGVEIGLRGKLRHNAAGAPENTFNSNGDGTYTFKSGVAPTQSYPTAEWSFEWAINTDYEGTTGTKLDDLTYELSITGPGVAPVAFDPINDINPGNGMLLWDHSMGDNLTGNGAGIEAADAIEYATNIADLNVAQQSWKPHWIVPGFNPELNGEYTISLTASDLLGQVASSTIVINAVPEPGSIALMGLAGLFGSAVYLRRRWA